LRRAPAALALLVVAVLFVADVPRFEPPHDVLITDDRSGDTYVRSDGQSSALTDLCGSSRQEQEEPSVAIDPREPDVVAVGANDGCGARFATGWMGFYRSEDGGETWTRSLVPGFRQDSSDDGRRSPAHRDCDGASDPALAYDTEGRLYYAFICFGADRLGEPSLFVARYAADGEDYLGTVTVRPSGTTGFEDKPAIAVDTTGGDHDGSTYVVWTDFSAFNGRVEFCSAVWFAASTNDGRSFGEAEQISRGVCGTVADVAVGPRGSIYVAFRSNQKIWVVASTDGGSSFGKPLSIANVNPYTGQHYTIATRSCGDGPGRCRNGRTFPRTETIPSVVVDAAGVHVAWAALDPVGRARVYVKSSADGRRWDVPGVQVHPAPVGHQWMPDMATDGDHLDVVYLDSRDDPSFAPALPPGETWKGRNSGDVVHTMLARSTDGGVTWTEQRLSTHGSNPNWEIQDSARTPFYGDYLSVALAGGRGFAAWPDSRDLVPGRDSRETGDADDHDGFDGYLPCPWNPDDIDADSYQLGSDTCLTAGGLDLNVYGTSFDP